MRAAVPRTSHAPSGAPASRPSTSRPRGRTSVRASNDFDDYEPTVDLPLATLKLGRRCGVGSFGEVFQATLDSAEPTPVIAKRPKGSNNRASKRFFAAEAHACRRLKNVAGLPPFLGVCGADAFLVWRDCGLTTLDSLLKARKPGAGAAAQAPLSQALLLPGPPEESRAVKTLARRLLAAAASLHSAGFVHRDVKPSNVLLADDGKVLLLDLGAAADCVTRRFFNEDEAVFDPLWGAPEQFLSVAGLPPPGLGLAGLFASSVLGGPRPALFDSFSVGLVILLTAVPQLGNSSSDRLSKLKKALAAAEGAGAEALEAWRAGLPDTVRRDMGILDAENGAGWSLVCALAAPDPRKRMSCEAALGHRWLKGIK